MLVLAMEFSRSRTSGGAAASLVRTEDDGAKRRRSRSEWRRGRPGRDGIANVGTSTTGPTFPRESLVVRAEGPPYWYSLKTEQRCRASSPCLPEVRDLRREVQLGSRIASASTGSCALPKPGETVNSLERR